MGLSGFPLNVGASDPSVNAGAAWLSGRIQADGSLQGEAASLALPPQQRAEALQTLALVTPPGNAALADAIAATTYTFNEYVARQTVALDAAGHAVPAFVSRVMASRNDDGGFGAYPGARSNPLDTALALLALHAAPTIDPQVPSSALGYLRQTLDSNGGVGINGQSSVYVSAYVIIAADAWKTQFLVGAIVQPVTNWLLARRQVGQYGNALDNAVALLALATQSNDSAVITPLADTLRQAQSATGSWGDDAFVTALATRALWLLTQAPPAPTTGTIAGIVANASTGASIVGATIQLIERTESITTSEANGGFALDTVPPGSYTLHVSAIGFASAQVSVAVQAGQLVQVGRIRLSPAPLTASLSGVVRNASGSALSDALVAVGTATALTNAQGQYLLSTLNAGPVTITVSKSGYRTVTSNLVLEAGLGYVFSPALTGSSSPVPTDSTLKGRVLNQTTSAAIPGARVAVGAKSVNTGTDGRFQLAALPVGAFEVEVSATGYGTLRGKGSLAAGVNDLGDFKLVQLPTSSTLTGTVTNVDSNAPVSGAKVAVQGTSLSAITDATGNYRITGIANTTFQLLVTATGYNNATFDVSLSQHGEAALSLRIAAIAGGGGEGLGFRELHTSKAEYGPYEEFEIEVEAQNTTATAAAMIVEARVIDEQGQISFELKANAQGLGQNPPNMPIALPANSVVEIEMERLLLRQPAGLYTVLARGYDANGRMVAQRTTQFTVRAEPQLAGGVILDPPLTQAGTSTPVSLRAELNNTGNQPIPAGDYEFTVTLQAADSQTSTQPQADVRALMAGAPLKEPRGASTDAAGNVYVANSDGKIVRITPSNTTEVVAAIGVSLGDVARASDGTFWATEHKGSRLFRVDPQGVRTEFKLSTLSSIRGLALEASGDLLMVGDFSGASTEYRLVRRSAAGAETVLWSNGLAEPIAMVKDGSGNLIVANQRDNSLSKVLPGGTVQPFATGLNRPYGLARDSAGNLFVANSGNNTLVRIAPDGTQQTYATGLNQPGDIALDATGALFVVNRGDNTLLRVPSAGTVEVFARGLANGPQGMVFDSAGNLLIVNDDGSLRQKDPSDRVTILATGLSGPRGVLPDEAGGVLVASYTDGTVRRVAGGTVSTFATGLKSPFGIARDNNGEFAVTEYEGQRITRLSATGAVLGRTESVISNPQKLRVDASGRLFILNNDSVSVREGAITRIHTRTSFGDIAPDGSGGFVGISNTNVYRVSAEGVVTLLRNLSFSPSGIALGGGGLILLADQSGKKIQKLDASNMLSVHATLTESPSEIVSDGLGTSFVRTASSRVLKITAGGDVTELANLASVTLYLIGMSADGRPIALTGGAGFRVLTLHPDTGAQTEIARSLPNSHGLALSATGRLTLADNSNSRILDYTGSTQTGEVSGFRSPKGIVWTGSEFRFVDQTYLYSMAPGGYPVRLGSFPANYLAVRNDTVIGTGSNLIKWAGTNYQTISTLPSPSSLKGVAATADGSLLVAMHGDSRVVVLNSINQPVKQYAGLVSPVGLAIDAAGDLYVANNVANTIVRFRGRGFTPELLVRNVSSVRHLAFDATGRLWVTRAGGAVSRVDTQSGVVTDVASDSGASLWGLLMDGDRVYTADSTRNQIRQVSGSVLGVLTSGLYSPSSVRVDGQGAAYIISRSNGTISRYSNGQLEVRTTGLVNPNVLSLREDGGIIVVGDSAVAYEIGPNGTVRDMRIAPQVSSVTLSGITRRGDGFVTFSNSPDSAFLITVTQPPAPPAVGTVVHQVLRTAAVLPAGEALLTVDFGSWVPPYGGDFKAEVRRAGVNGAPLNFLHAGPHANGVLSTLTPTVPPGDRAVPLRLQLSGADFTSISRVETASFRRLVNIGFPKGMTADRLGNLYFTTADALNKVAPGGAVTPVLTGLNMAFGLATDSQENLYLPNRTSANRYELVRVAPGGTRTAVADLGTAAVSGVGVNSNDHVIVARANGLLRVNPANGSVTTVATTGVSEPLGVAVDGRDNVYVQNNNNVVTQILPDGRTRTIFSKANGIDEPTFEGDGYPTITADCADNFYITAWKWERVGQNGEEHVLSQVVPRTGQVVGLLDTVHVVPTVGDIDYLSFDRFGNRILMWDHNTSAIYQVPVTCGAIAVEAHLITQPGQTLTGFDVAPAATIRRADSRTEYVWSLRDVTSEGLAINFDTQLRSLALGERRSVIDSGFIVFKNSFSPTDVRVPIVVPQVEATNLVSLSVTTNRPEYTANLTARITTTLRNTNTTAVAGDLVVSVLDAEGQWVGEALRQAVTLEAGSEPLFTGEFAIGTIVPGTYTARAALWDASGVKAQGTASFVVLPDNSSASATSRLQLDRLRFSPFDRVRIASSAVSQSANLTLENLLLTVKVTDSNGVVLGTTHHQIDQLVPTATRTFSALQALNNAAPGVYRVHQTLRDAQDRLYDARAVDFTVVSSSETGAGITGTLAAQPSEGEVGTAIRFDATVTNGGNADLTNVPLKLVVLDLVKGTVLWSRDAQRSIARGAQVGLTESWSTTSVLPGDYTAVLIATFGGRELTLARADVRLTARQNCIEVRLSDYNLFLQEDYTGGHDVVGKVAAGRNIIMTDFAVGTGLAPNQIANSLVAGGNLTLSRGGVWGDARYGGTYSADTTVVYPRGTWEKGTPIDFAGRFAELRTLSSRLAALPANGTTVRENWGGIMLRGTKSDVNVFDVSASAFTGAVLWSIEAPAGSFVVVNIRGASASFGGFGISFSGGINQHGVLYNFVDTTSITAQGFGFWGTVLAPKAQVNFSNGSWDGGIYAKAFTGNAEGHINPLNNRDICQ